MRIYWIKAQAPRRVLALAKHLGIKAELVEMDVRRKHMRAHSCAFRPGPIPGRRTPRRQREIAKVRSSGPDCPIHR